VVLGKDFEGHLANLRAVLVRFREYGLKLKPKKCELFQKEVEFLGRVVGPRGIYIGPGYINAVLEQSSGLIFTCQYAELASSLEHHTFPAKVSRHSSTRGNGNTSLMVLGLGSMG
jgi:hypothetical protein